jgi:uncharacterized protein
MKRTPARAILAFGLLLAGCGGGGPTAPPTPTPAGGDSFESGDARLRYVIDLPSGAGPFPGVVIGHGAGAVGIGDGAAYVPFLTARGFAVLRYDKRGVGQSTGTYRGVSAANSVAQVDELANDMVAAATFLARRPNVAGHHVGLMGTSQAGWVMVAAAAKTPVIRFAIAVTGSVEPVGVNIAYEQQRGAPIDEAYAQLARYSGPRGYDPAPTLAALTIPTLWLLGAEDRLVPTRDCVTLLQGLQRGGAPAEFVVFPGVGHGLPGADYWPAIDAFIPRALDS